MQPDRVTKLLVQVDVRDNPFLRLVVESDGPIKEAIDNINTFIESLETVITTVSTLIPQIEELVKRVLP